MDQGIVNHSSALRRELVTMVLVPQCPTKTCKWGKKKQRVSSIEAKEGAVQAMCFGNYSLAIDHSPPVENVASLVNGFLIHVVVSHRHLHVTVA